MHVVCTHSGYPRAPVQGIGFRFGLWQVKNRKLPRAAQLQTTREKKRGNWNVAATELDADAVGVGDWQLVASVGPRVCYSVPF